MPTYDFNPITRELDIAGTSASLATPVAVADGGTGSTGVQNAINTLTQSSGASDRQMLMAISGTASFRYVRVPEYTSDPSANSGDLWVLRTDSGTSDGNPTGLLLSMVQSVGTASTYQLSFKTNSGSTLRTTLS